MRTRLVSFVLALALAALACPARVGDTPPTSDSGLVPDGGPADAGTPLPPDDGGTYGLDARAPNPSCLPPARPSNAASISLSRAFPSLQFNAPVLLLQAPGDDSRVFVVERTGRIWAFANQDNTTSRSLFIDLTDRVNANPGEAGLLGIAFHPQWTANHQAFISYTDNGPQGLRSVIARFTSPDNGQTLDRDTTFPILTVNQPYDNHNGGNLAFGPDGFLYIGLGDGGDANDPDGNGQSLNTLLGKFLRVDVDSGSPYAIPPSNPFASGGGRPEIYAWGFRNPWRWSFDRATGELWAGDVGQGSLEEVDKVLLGGNYGWKIKEGRSCFQASTCNSAGLIDPIAQYPRSQGVSITGGYVYRGANVPSLTGKFVYGDFQFGNIWAVGINPQTGEAQVEALATGTNLAISSFGQDNQGELYVLNYFNGTIHRIGPGAQGPASDPFPQLLSATGCVDPADPKKPAVGLVPYSIQAELWSDGATKERHFALPDGATLQVEADGDFTFPVGAVLMKTFLLNGRRVETRLLMRHDDGNWGGYSYEWNDAQTDATLLPAGKVVTFEEQSWTFPSRGECLACHTQAAGRTLGPETAQLNRAHLYATGRSRNQLLTLEGLGYLSAPLGAAPETLPALPRPTGDGALEPRARAYLHANCAHCHRPGGPGLGSMDLRSATPLADAAICDVAPTQGTAGIAGARRFAPGNPAASLISVRMHALDALRMPPLGTRQVDTAGTALLDAWMVERTSCAP